MNVMSPTSTTITIPPADLRTAQFHLVGTAPLMVHKFSHKVTLALLHKKEQGSTGKKGKAREAANLEEIFHEARHISTEGWDGLPAAAFRAACISACRLVGFKMTLAKLSVFVVADGYDATEGTPLVRIIGGTPERNVMAARNATGVVDTRIRPMWREWAVDLTVRYDAGQFTASDLANLLMRAGQQVGVGEGRPDSKMSAGLGFGTFEFRGVE